ncbi:MAG: hypothetical protein KGM92_15750, partial [Acidobacteriota bacterium]|nr:hypothetical protein [Acidobacteriota bacterium]
RPRLLVNGVTIYTRPVGAEQGKTLTPRGGAGAQELVVLYSTSQHDQLRARDMRRKILGTAGYRNVVVLATGDDLDRNPNLPQCGGPEGRPQCRRQGEDGTHS